MPSRKQKRLLLSMGLAGLLSATGLLGHWLGAQEIPRFRIKEERARSLFEKGLRFFHNQKYVAAREFFYQALNVHPYFHLARRYLGDAYYYSGEWQGALEQWEFLGDITGNDYPLVRQRSELLRFYLNEYRNPGKLIYLTSFPEKKWSNVDFKQPVSLAKDHNNRLYILSFGSKNIIKLSPDGSVESEITGGLFDRLQGPLAFVIKKSLVYVSDFVADEVRVFDLKGREQFRFGKTGSGNGEFHGPHGIAVSTNAIYVSDTGNHRIQKFDLAGRFLMSFGDNKSLEYPTGLLWFEDRLYVCDREQAALLSFDESGNFLESITSPLLKKPQNVSLGKGRLLLADENAGILFYDLSKKSWQALPLLRNSKDQVIEFSKVFFALEDESGRVYIADYGKNRIWLAIPQGLRTSNLDMKIQRVDTSDFSHIGVFLTIRNRLGQPLRGLGPRDIWLYENDQRIGGIRTDNTKPYNRRLLSVLVKENSEFFKKRFSIYLEESLKGFLADIRKADHIELIRVGEQVRPVYEGLERQRLLRHLREGETSSEPNLGKGLMAAITSLVPKIGPRNVLLLISGHNFPNAYLQFPMQRIKQYALANGIAISIISWEGEKDPKIREELREKYQNLAKETGGDYYRAFDSSRLANLSRNLRKKIDERYILTYDSKIDPDLHDRYVDLRVEVHHLGMVGKADAGFFVP